jgi:hypothetical protein
MIKRKINVNQNNPNAEDLDFLELAQERDFKNLSKKNLEEVYSKVLKNLDDIKSRQSDIEFKIDTVKEKNEIALNENESLKKDFEERKNYTKNLEFLIILILELTASTERNQVNSPGSVNAEFNENICSNSNSLSDLVFRNDNERLDSISKLMTYNDKAYVLKNLIENCNDALIKSMVTTCLEKYNLKLEDLDISISKKSKPEFKYTSTKPLSTTDNSPAQIKENSQKLIGDNNYDMFSDNKQDKPTGKGYQYKFKFGNGGDLNLNSGNISTPTSILSTNECIFGVGNKIITPNQPRTPTGNYLKRKKNEDQGGSGLEICSGDLNLNQKEKDSMFDEVNGVTPFLISSPNMSPARMRRFDSMNLNNECNENLYRPTPTASINPIFFNNNYTVGPSHNSIQINPHKSVYNQTKYNPENFFSFCEDNLNSSSLLNKKHN